MFGVFLSDFISPMFWTMAGIGAYFLILAIAEKRGKDIGTIGVVSGAGFSIGMLIYCFRKFF